MPVASRKTTGRAARRVQIQHDLLTVVEEALEHGETYSDLSIGRLVDAAKISRSTFYTYFEDKADLLRALTEQVVSELGDEGQTWWSLPPSASKAELLVAITEAFEVYRRSRLLWGAVVETAGYDPAVRERYVRTLGLSIASMSEHIRSGQEHGFVRPGLDPDRTAAWITWMGERGLYQMQPSTTTDVAELAAGFTDIIWDLLYEGTRPR